jgi:hypothetical protein
LPPQQQHRQPAHRRHRPLHHTQRAATVNTHDTRYIHTSCDSDADAPASRARFTPRGIVREIGGDGRVLILDHVRTDPHTTLHHWRRVEVTRCDVDHRDAL